MIIGGKNESYGRWIDDIDLVSPYGNTIPDCLLNISPFTKGHIVGSAGAALASDGIPLLCGGCIGRTPYGSTCHHSETCYKYDPLADTWSSSGRMSGRMVGVASDYTDSFGLAMAHEGEPLHVTQDGITFESLASYPNPEVSWGAGDDGCVVILDDKNLFLAGGGSRGSRKAYIYNKDSNAWRALSDMTHSRKYHSCGLVKSDSGDEVVVVGGDGSPKSIEIFSISTETWRSGNEMPFGIMGAYDIRLNGTFVMGGGRENNVVSDKLRLYLPESGTFMELPGKMKTRRWYATAILVDRSIFPPCS